MPCAKSRAETAIASVAWSDRRGDQQARAVPACAEARRASKAHARSPDETPNVSAISSVVSSWRHTVSGGPATATAPDITASMRARSSASRRRSSAPTLSSTWQGQREPTMATWTSWCASQAIASLRHRAATLACDGVERVPSRVRPSVRPWNSAPVAKVAWERREHPPSSAGRAGPRTAPRCPARPEPAGHDSYGGGTPTTQTGERPHSSRNGSLARGRRQRCAPQRRRRRPGAATCLWAWGPDHRSAAHRFRHRRI